VKQHKYLKFTPNPQFRPFSKKINVATSKLFIGWETDAGRGDAKEKSPDTQPGLFSTMLVNASKTD
jgi:hypothetical protein